METALMPAVADPAPRQPQPHGSKDAAVPALPPHSRGQEQQGTSDGAEAAVGKLPRSQLQLEDPLTFTPRLIKAGSLSLNECVMSPSLTPSPSSDPSSPFHLSDSSILSPAHSTGTPRQASATTAWHAGSGAAGAAAPSSKPPAGRAAAGGTSPGVLSPVGAAGRNDAGEESLVSLLEAAQQASAQQASLQPVLSKSRFLRRVRSAPQRPMESVPEEQLPWEAGPTYPAWPLLPSFGMRPTLLAQAATAATVRDLAHGCGPLHAGLAGRWSDGNSRVREGPAVRVEQERAGMGLGLGGSLSSGRQQLEQQQGQPREEGALVGGSVKAGRGVMVVPGSTQLQHLLKSATNSVVCEVKVQPRAGVGPSVAKRPGSPLFVIAGDWLVPEEEYPFSPRVSDLHKPHELPLPLPHLRSAPPAAGPWRSLLSHCFGNSKRQAGERVVAV